MTDLIAWPAPSSVQITSKGYDTPDGCFPRTTSITKLLGTGTDALINWGASVERDACLEAATTVYVDGTNHSTEGFKYAVEQKLGTARAHVRQLAKAGDIGGAIHEAIRWTLMSELGQDVGPKPDLKEGAGWGFMAWKAWWEAEKNRGAKPLRIEQPVWSKILRVGGTIDFVCDYPDGLHLIDWKSASGIYDNFHLQVTGYAMQAYDLLGVKFARKRIVRIPKVVGETDVYEKEVGDLTYDYVSKKDNRRKLGGRHLTDAELCAAFKAIRTLYDCFSEAA